MSDTRATKSGFALEAQKKLAAKYDPGRAEMVMNWIQDAIRNDDAGFSLNASGDSQNVQAQLEDGIVLLRLYKAIVPSYNFNHLDPKQTKSMNFNKRERIEKFATAIQGAPLSIPQHSVLTVVDLIEGQNIGQVITCLETVAGKCLKAQTRVRGFGPKESDANVRHFSDEQMAQGKSVIGLQMGSNKGASQAGQNFGKARHIVD